MGRRFPSRHASGAPRRKTFWVASADISAQAVLAADTAILHQSVTWTDELGLATIVRTRGTLWVTTDQTGADEQPFGALGFSVVTTQASTAGVASVPTPTTDENDDSFFVWIPWLASNRFGSGVGFEQQAFMQYDFDSKAMRKVTEGQDIIITLENASALHGMDFVIKFRMLIKAG